jgi:diguanylate cyclase (GGDEF)-like protein
MLFKKETIKVLLLDDSEAAYATLVLLLDDPCINASISWVRTVDEALTMLGDGGHDIALIDNILSRGETGFDLLCNPAFKALQIPAVFIATQGDEYTAVKALKAGAFDYLVKDRCDSSRLMYAINEAIKDARYRKQVEAHQIELIKLASTDELTGLHNRRHFRSQLENELFRFSRYKMPLSIALVDVDHFKKINDEYGHDAGDYVLKTLGKLLRGSLRSTDTVARYGGEEFVIAFPNTALFGAEVFAERLRGLIEGHFFYYDHMSIPVTVSIGVAEAYSEIAHSDTLLKLADKALYTAKKEGRNCVISYKYGVGI